MSSPLMSNVESAKMEELMRHLENALNPKVTFSEDLERMRQEAEQNRISEIKAAIRILYGNVAGLTVRPHLDEEVSNYSQ